VKPDLVIDEPVATGWARVEVYGDQEAGRALLHLGRVQLGTMRSGYGVNERLAQGQATGFCHQWSQLPDGSRIHTVHNEGHDTIRLYAARSAEHRVEKQRLDDFDPGAYLWVGIRVKDGVRHPFYALDFWLLEPTNPNAPGRGIVGTGFSSIDAWTVGLSSEFVQQDGGGYLMQLRAGLQQDGDNADALALAMYDTWYDTTRPPPFSSTMSFGDHDFLLSAIVEPGVLGTNQYNNFTDVGFTRNGLFAMYHDDANPFWGPYDPKMSAEQNRGLERDLSQRIDSGGSGNSYSFGWDAVCWIDPFAAQLAGRTTLVDDRARTLAMQKFLVDNEFTSKGRAQVLPGQYLLVARAYDTPTHYESSRAGQAIPVVGGTRSVSCDYDDYDTLVRDWPPLQVEVEVRIGRSTLTQRVGLPDDQENVADIPARTFHFDLTCQRYDERFAVVYPHGSLPDYDDCGKDNGPNMGGPSFSQVVGIDVLGQSAEIVGEVGAMAPFLGQAAFHEYASQQRRTAVFMVSTAFPQPGSQADWEAKAGTALFTAAEKVTSGQYGCADMHGELSEAEAQAMFAGTDRTHVWAWFPRAGHSLVDLGVPTGVPADWAYHDPPFDSTNFAWYYTLAVPYRNQCYRTFGVVATSVGGFYELTDNFVGATGFEQPDCC
jgi:hypothetical protein